MMTTTYRFDSVPSASPISRARLPFYRVIIIITNVPAAYPLVSLFWSWVGTATLGHDVFSDNGQTLQTAQLVILPFL